MTVILNPRLMKRRCHYECFTSHYKFHGLSENELGKKIRSRIIGCFWANSIPGSVTRSFNPSHRISFCHFWFNGRKARNKPPSASSTSFSKPFSISSKTPSIHRFSIPAIPIFWKRHSAYQKAASGLFWKRMWLMNSSLNPIILGIG